MAGEGSRYRYHCDICGEPVGLWNESSHKASAHPEVLAVQRSQGRRYILRYYPLAMIGLAVAGVSIILQQAWWRIGFLAGIYSMFAILLIFGAREWKVERSVRLDVVTSCAVCDSRMAIRDYQTHLRSIHPEIWRLARRSAWLLSPGIYVILVYVLVLVGVMVAAPMPDSFWSLVPALLFVPVFAWMVILAVVGIVLNQTRLKPARRNWQMSHP